MAYHQPNRGLTTDQRRRFLEIFDSLTEPQKTLLETKAQGAIPHLPSLTSDKRLGEALRRRGLAVGPNTFSVYVLTEQGLDLVQALKDQMNSYPEGRHPPTRL